MNTNNGNTLEKPGRQYVLMVMLVMALLSALLPSCTHDPFTPIDPGPIDTTGNPMDTTGNPIDTTNYDPCDPDVVYFDMQILPILVSNCAKSGCHDVATHEEGIIIDSYEHIINSNEHLIRAFDLNGSKLYKVITENDADDVMPPAPNQKLTSEQITLISKWILQGARDLTCDVNPNTCDTTSVSYAGFVAPLLSTYCVGCHSGGAPSGGIALNNFTGVQAVALNGRLIGAITWASGFQRMPLNGAKLSECNINKIKAWVHNGASNN